MGPIHNIAPVIFFTFCSWTQNLHPPVESELTLCPEEVDVVLELEFEHIVLGDVVTGGGGVHVVAEQGQGRQGEVVLKGFVKVEAEIGEDHPEFLPSVGVFELPEKISW